MTLMVRAVEVLAIPAGREESLGTHAKTLLSWQFVAIIGAGRSQTLVVNGAVLKLVRVESPMFESELHRRDFRQNVGNRTFERDHQ